ncbi:MAG TPA: hypothetical protein VJL35_12575 [Gemmatimonadaceae bacterium]|nr:hypothetical protein [Gemmatimonadaceae bacterium]
MNADIRMKELKRISISLGIAGYSYLLFAFSQRLAPGHSDFSVIWFAARALLEGNNPYAVIGPGRAIPFGWELHYPLSTLVAAIPLALIRESWSDFMFVFGSAFLLAYGALRHNLNRIWIFASAAYVVNAKSAQWSALTASGFFLPAAAALACLKPSDGLAVLAGTGRRSWMIAGSVAVALIVISFLILPSWPRYWMTSVTGTWEFVSPVRRAGGFLLLLSVLRWRTREGRFLFVLSLVPQVQSWYAGVLPLLVARSKRENQILSLVSSLGYVIMIPLALDSATQEISTFSVGRLMIAFCYLPALIAVLKRPNTAEAV